MEKNLLRFILTIFLGVLVILTGTFIEADAQIYRTYIEQRSEMQNYKALLYRIDEGQQFLRLHFLNGERNNYKIDEDLIIFDNREEIDISELKEGDGLIVSLGPNSEIKFLEKIDYTLGNNKDLTDLGYRDDITIYGTDISQDIFFPFRENMDRGQMQLYLNLEYSKFIEADSKLMIKIEDEDIYLNSVSELEKEIVSDGIYRSEILIDLSRYIDINDLNDRVIKVSVLADLNTNLNRCEEANSDVFFFRIKNNSALRSRNETYFNYNISDFMNFKFDKANIHLAEELSSEMAEAYIKLRLFLDRNFPNLKKEVFFGSNYSSNRIISRNVKTANIFIKDDNKIDLDRNFNLSIGSQAADSFISQVRKLYLNDEMEIIEFNENKDKKRQLSISDLGFNSLVFNGIGEIERNIAFTSADLGFNPEELDLYINSQYTSPINNLDADKDNSYLKIYFNGQMIRAHQLDQSGNIDNLHVDLPIYLLEQENNISFVYSYYPLGRDCAADGQDFEAVISPDSYLDVKGEKVDDVITFNNILNNFYGEGKIMLDIDNPELSLKHAAELISSFRKLDSRPLDINVDFINSDQEFSVDDNFRWAAAVLAEHKDYNTDDLFKIKDEEIIVQENSEEFTFEGQTSNSSAFWQLDKIDGRPFAFIAASDLNQESLKSLELLGRKINDIDFFRSLNGTLLLSSGGRLTDFAADEYGSVEADQRSQLVNIYKEYKAQILIAAVILVIILAYILYIKLAQKPEDTNE